MKKKEEYIICPRCELNYILKRDRFCLVCRAEMSGDSSSYEDLDLEVCPICKVNFIRSDEIMCTNCAKEHSLAGTNIKEDLSDDEWQTYLNLENEKEDVVEEDEETGEMATITDLDDEEIEEIEIEDPELTEGLKFDDDSEEDLEEKEDDDEEIDEDEEDDDDEEDDE